MRRRFGKQFDVSTVGCRRRRPLRASTSCGNWTGNVWRWCRYDRLRTTRWVSTASVPLARHSVDRGRSASQLLCQRCPLSTSASCHFYATFLGASQHRKTLLTQIKSIKSVDLLRRPTTKALGRQYPYRSVLVFKARFPLPELTARVNGWPVSITRQHGPCWRAGRGRRLG